MVDFSGTDFRLADIRAWDAWDTFRGSGRPQGEGVSLGLSICPGERMLRVNLPEIPRKWAEIHRKWVLYDGGECSGGVLESGWLIEDDHTGSSIIWTSCSDCAVFGRR